MKKIIIIVLAVVLIVVGFSGCINNTTPDNSNKPIIPDNKPPVITPTYDDTEFMSWLYDTNDELATYNDNEVDALDNEYWYSLEYYAEAEEDLIDDTFKPECLSFDLSNRYDIIRDEYYEYLSDRSWACFYMKWAGIDMQDDLYSLAADNFNDATEYTTKATTHLNTCISLIKG